MIGGTHRMCRTQRTGSYNRRPVLISIGSTKASSTTFDRQRSSFAFDGFQVSMVNAERTIEQRR
jgi:hypothetical protein